MCGFVTVTKLHIFSRKSVSEGEGVGINKLLLNEKGGPDGTAFFGGIVMICGGDLHPTGGVTMQSFPTKSPIFGDAKTDDMHHFCK